MASLVQTFDYFHEGGKHRLMNLFCDIILQLIGELARGRSIKSSRLKLLL